MLRRAAREGAVIVNPRGSKIPRTGPAVLQELLDRVQASMTKPMSLRIPASDIEAKRRIAAKKGIGYQTVLKQAIREGLPRV